MPEGVPMRRPMVAGNWKMHGSRAANQALLAELEQRLKPEWPIDIVVFPPYVYLARCGAHVGGRARSRSVRRMCAPKPGVRSPVRCAAAMLKDVGCRYVIVGHSERRRLYHEDDALGGAQVCGGAGRPGLTPVLCVGETLEEREAKRTEAVVAPATRCGDRDARGRRVCRRPSSPTSRCGPSERAARPRREQAQAVHAYLRSRIDAQDAKMARHLRILYGGSVKAGNAAELFSMPDVDGGLVGGASLSADEFLEICAAAAVHPAIERFLCCVVSFWVCMYCWR